MAVDALGELRLEGPPFERGLRHGRELREEIGTFLADRQARVNAIRARPLEAPELQAAVRAHQRIIEEDVPAIAEELRGLAEGAGISYEDAVLLQIRRELVGEPAASGVAGDCTLVATQEGPDGPLVAQTIDLNGNLGSLGVIVRVVPERPEQPEILSFTFAGLLGYLGMNSAGLAVGINLVSSAPWRPGVSPYLLVRHLLDQTSVEACLREIRRIRRASSRSLTLMDGQRLVIAELTVDEDRVLEGRTLFHANHFLHPELVKRDRLNILSKSSSIKRQKHLTEAVGRPGGTSVESLFEAFSDHFLFPVGMCAHAEGDVRRGETVGAVVMQPARRRLFARKGTPCQATTRLFQLGDVLPGGLTPEAPWT